MTEANMLSTGAATDHVPSPDDFVQATNGVGSHAQSGASGQQTGRGIVGRVKESATAQLTHQKDRGVDALVASPRPFARRLTNYATTSTTRLRITWNKRPTRWRTGRVG